MWAILAGSRKGLRAGQMTLPTSRQLMPEIQPRTGWGAGTAGCARWRRQATRKAPAQVLPDWLPARKMTVRAREGAARKSRWGEAPAEGAHGRKPPRGD